jgi:DUF1680 family protein
MKNWAICCLGLGLIFSLSCRSKTETTAPDYPTKPVPFTEVHFTDMFWAPRLETNRSVTIPYALEQCVETGRVRNFEEAAKVLKGEIEQGRFCSTYPFDDSDLYKIMEGASYALLIKKDPRLDARLDEMIAKIAAAQEEDGYIYTARTVNAEEPHPWIEEERWTNLYMAHELYNAGHMYEAAVAHFMATGKRSFLDIAIRNANLVDSVFGPGKKIGVPGHEEIEIGLVKLYRVTGERRYLDLAKFFLDQRGRGEERNLFGQYSQDHKPIIEQEEAVGHAVRAAYMYSGVADVAALTDDKAFLQAVDRIWEDAVGSKIYITGGIGSRGSGEAFGEQYDLPNATAYAETCASIANAFWNHRMFLLHSDARYIDVLERVLYNGILSGVALTGDLFFYSNPLESFGQHKRSPWFACACCPSNVSRFMPSIPGYVYAKKEGSLYINLFADSKADIDLAHYEVGITQETRYPWEGNITITVSLDSPQTFAINIRIPGWALGQPIPGDLYTYLDEWKEEPLIKVNGEEVLLELDRGYVPLRREWRDGDVIELYLPMPIRRVKSHVQVLDNADRAALVRGPVVYCAEWPDNEGFVSNLVLPDDSLLQAEWREDLLNGVVLIKGSAVALFSGGEEGNIGRRTQSFTAIPYYSWAHRGEGEMAVWLPRRADLARPLPKETVASTSRATASQDKKAGAVNDQWEPKNSDDHSHPYLHWWPSKGTEEWVQYDFKEPAKVSSVQVYWFDDTGQGGCRVPASWTVLYKRGNRWLPVQNQGVYGTAKDQYNMLDFTPVETSALRLVIQLQENYAAGILEWKVR